MSAKILPESGSDSKYVSRVRALISECAPEAVVEVIAIVAGLEAALHRQAQDEVDIELRLTALEENVLRRLDNIVSTLEERDK